MITTYTGSGGHKSGEWPKSFWENGYRKMMFFHPKVQYKEYKNDLKNKMNNILHHKHILLNYH